MTKSNLRLAIIITTVLTAVIHLYLGVIQVLGGMMGGIIFLLNAGGFSGLLALFMGWLPFKVPMLSDNKTNLHYAFMGFSAVTIVAYFVVNGGAAFMNPVGLFTKAVEVVLIVALWLHLQK